ncbi:DeoR family transcriptional regulator [Planococcus donghaensis]|uniref:HTH deoR-type domain-containing protein n=1 Tax=Planococcus donghaensis TaxID=414778 RepID=A0A1C7EDV1_9BACL|nr:DeoR family transcriptional regulator [Planococcus donghaensis]ANU22050.1 hypothetical protein BCM40_01280 [Planococcus donghaensis]
MLPIERKKQILTWLQKVDFLRVTEISKRLNVSEMTVYRDVAALVKEGKVLKTSNGIAVAGATADFQGCVYCAKPIHTRLTVQLILTDDQIEQTCCMHCALLRYSKIEFKVAQLICQDFLTDTTINAKKATFLIDSTAQINCCRPEVLPFASQPQAQQFQYGFGGQLMLFDEALIELKQAMTGQACRH